MNLENQVCSLELSKRLKELGVKQESLFYYQNQPFNDGTNDIGICIKEIISANNGNSIMNTYSMDEFDEPIYSAFTVAELGEMLQWEKLYIFNVPEKLLKYVDGRNTEADARAKMLIYLLENKLMELPNE